MAIPSVPRSQQRPETDSLENRPPRCSWPAPLLRCRTVERVLRRWTVDGTMHWASCSSATRRGSRCRISALIGRNLSSAVICRLPHVNRNSAFIAKRRAIPLSVRGDVRGRRRGFGNDPNEAIAKRRALSRLSLNAPTARDAGPRLRSDPRTQ